MLQGMNGSPTKQKVTDFKVHFQKHRKSWIKTNPLAQFIS